MSNNGWTQERRLRQSEVIRNWKPWEKSTGAKTSQGKEKSKMNAYKHGGRSLEYNNYSAFLQTPWH